MQYARTELLQITVNEHKHRCGVENKGDMINYTISNQPDIEFPNRSGILLKPRRKVGSKPVILIVGLRTAYANE